MENICVLGGGSWGTAIARLLSLNGHNVKLWCFKKTEADKLNIERENKEFLPGIIFPENLLVTSDDEEAIKDSTVIVIVLPSKTIRDNLNRFKKFISENHLIVNMSKGFEEKTLFRLSEVIEDVLPNNKVCVLSGPTHAEEVSRDIPTTITAASKDVSVAERVQNIFMNEMFRVYTNTDVIGVELGGALKNVIALCAGISDGLAYGDNTKAALMTRGLSEITKLGVKMGGLPETFNGLTGLGDLIVTCTSMHSRNRRAGILIGKGKNLEETLEEIHMVVEGVENSKSAYKLSKKFEVEMPIIDEAYKVLFENKNPREAVYDLMTREKKSEHANENEFMN